MSSLPDNFQARSVHSDTVSALFNRIGGAGILGWDADGQLTPFTAGAASSSPAFTGIPTAPTAAAGTNTTQLATTAFVTRAAPATPYVNAMAYRGLTGNGQPIVADGTLHTLASYYSTLAAAKADYPNAASLSDSIDAVVLNACIVAAVNRPVWVGKGRLVVNIPIKWDQSDLIGSGSGDFRGTEINLADNSNCNVIESANFQAQSDWQHFAHLRNFHIDGNKANNTTGNGVAVWQMGETAEISHVLVNNAAESGFLIKGDHAPARLHNVNASVCVAYGFNIDGLAMSNVTLDGPSGDSNASGFIRWYGASGNIIGLKSEGSHNPVVAVGGGSFVNILGGTANTITGTSEGKPSLVSVDTTGDGYWGAHINIQNLKLYGYNNILHDINNNRYYQQADGLIGNGDTPGYINSGRENFHFGGAQWTKRIYPEAGIVMTAPNGTRYLLTVANGGTLAITAI